MLLILVRSWKRTCMNISILSIKLFLANLRRERERERERDVHRIKITFSTQLHVQVSFIIFTQNVNCFVCSFVALLLFFMITL